MEQQNEVHIAAIHRPEVRITIVLLITIAVAALLHHAAAIPVEAAAVPARHTAVVVEAVPVHPVAAVAAVAVAVEDKHEQQKLKL